MASATNGWTSSFSSNIPLRAWLTAGQSPAGAMQPGVSLIRPPYSPPAANKINTEPEG